MQYNVLISELKGADRQILLLSNRATLCTKLSYPAAGFTFILSGLTHPTLPESEFPKMSA